MNETTLMNERMFIIEFMNGKTKKFDDSRFRYEIDYEGTPSMRVYSRITKGLVLDIPTLANVAFIHRNVIKKQHKPKNIEYDFPEENTLLMDPLPEE